MKSLKETKKLELNLNIEFEEQFYQQSPSAGENYGIPEPFKRQTHKMVKDTQTIRRQFADELFECV